MHEVLARVSKNTEVKSGQPLREVDPKQLNAPGSNGHAKKEEEPPAVKDAPPSVLEYFDGMFSSSSQRLLLLSVFPVIEASFRGAVERKSYYEALYYAVLGQEVRAT